ncbi:MAG: hypothetical protein QOJ55_188, partial [Solirubrobacteraceae bacterium]|nr:hypothetical protein [Solirubrobacteraceae bacterium]
MNRLRTIAVMAGLAAMTAGGTAVA